MQTPQDDWKARVTNPNLQCNYNKIPLCSSHKLPSFLLTSCIGLLPLCACPEKKWGVFAWWAEVHPQRDHRTSARENPSRKALQVCRVPPRQVGYISISEFCWATVARVWQGKRNCIRGGLLVVISNYYPWLSIWFNLCAEVRGDFDQAE